MFEVWTKPKMQMTTIDEFFVAGQCIFVLIALLLLWLLVVKLRELFRNRRR